MKFSVWGYNGNTLYYIHLGHLISTIYLIIMFRFSFFPFLCLYQGGLAYYFKIIFLLHKFITTFYKNNIYTQDKTLLHSIE